MKLLAISFELLGELDAKLGERKNAVKHFHRACPLIEFVGCYDGMGGSSFPLNQRCIGALRRLCDSDKELEDSCHVAFEKVATYQAWRRELLSWNEAETSQAAYPLEQATESATQVDEAFPTEEEGISEDDEQVITSNQ